jgi:hypothetical protein
MLAHRDASAARAHQLFVQNQSFRGFFLFLSSGTADAMGA